MMDVFFKIENPARVFYKKNLFFLTFPLVNQKLLAIGNDLVFCRVNQPSVFLLPDAIILVIAPESVGFCRYAGIREFLSKNIPPVETFIV